MNAVRTYIIFLYIFRLACLAFFLLEVFLCLTSYLFNNVSTKTLHKRQEDKIWPEICVTAYDFSYAEFNTSLNISFEEYKNGRWKIDGMNEEDLFNELAPKLSDLIKVLIPLILQEKDKSI